MKHYPPVTRRVSVNMQSAHTSKTRNLTTDSRLKHNSEPLTHLITPNFTLISTLQLHGRHHPSPQLSTPYSFQSTSLRCLQLLVTLNLIGHHRLLLARLLCPRQFTVMVRYIVVRLRLSLVSLAEAGFLPVQNFL